MTGPVEPVRRPPGPRRVSERRGDDRRSAERRTEEAPAPAETFAAPVPAPHEPEPKAAPATPGAFSAQLMAQGGEKRGLRGGPPVLESARSAYLEAEFLGRDRRTRKGRITKTEI